MTRTRWTTVLFAAVCLAQLAAPAALLAVREHTLTTGERFRFRCAPLDPVDVFRGRYVALRFDANEVSPGNLTLHYGERVAVALRTTQDGFAQLGTPSVEPPSSGPWIGVELMTDCAPST